MRQTYYHLFTLMICVLMGSCNNDDSTEVIINPTPLEQWSATWKGDDYKLAAYPDLFVNYWEYTYWLNENPNLALRIKGEFPHARFFSFTLYNDEKGDAIGGIDDFNIEPDLNSINPYTTTATGSNYFTVYIVPPTMSQKQIDKLDSKNICRVQEDVNRLAVCIRQYLGTDTKGNKHEYGGVDLPVVEAIDINTLKEVYAPHRTKSNIDYFPVSYTPQGGDGLQAMPFFLASKGAYYPNNSTDYLYARTILDKDSVLVFSFIPVNIPQKVEENRGANARYWSICFGSALNTRSYYSVHDTQAAVPDGEKCTFIVCLAQNPLIKEVEQRVSEMKIADASCQLIVWDSERLDIDNKPIGNTIVTMYRQILPNKDWPFSIANMQVTPYGNPVDNITNPDKQLAHKALGDYGPYGIKHSTREFLAND